MSSSPHFLLAFEITEIDAAHEFYVNNISCIIGRCADLWIDFNFFGHLISIHLVDGAQSSFETNPIDDEKCLSDTSVQY